MSTRNADTNSETPPFKTRLNGVLLDLLRNANWRNLFSFRWWIMTFWAIVIVLLVFVIIAQVLAALVWKPFTHLSWLGIPFIALLFLLLLSAGTVYCKACGKRKSFDSDTCPHCGHVHVGLWEDEEADEEDETYTAEKVEALLKQARKDAEKKARKEAEKAARNAVEASGD